MGLFDQIEGSLKGAVESAIAANGPTLINEALAKTNLGNLQGLVEQLQQGGLGTQVQSWLSNGVNIAVTPEQIQAALGNEQVKQMAEHFGIPVDAALKMLAEHLPAVVDQASPNGTVEQPAQ
jgi:uncharacterized protein YidB (DUF937 family)